MLICYLAFHLEYDRVPNGCISSPSYCSAYATSSLCGVQDILFIFKSHTLSMVGRISPSKCTIAISSQSPLRRHVHKSDCSRPMLPSAISSSHSLLRTASTSSVRLCISNHGTCLPPSFNICSSSRVVSVLGLSFIFFVPDDGCLRRQHLE